MAARIFLTSTCPCLADVSPFHMIYAVHNQPVSQCYHRALEPSEASVSWEITLATDFTYLSPFLPQNVPRSPLGLTKEMVYMHLEGTRQCSAPEARQAAQAGELHQKQPPPPSHGARDFLCVQTFQSIHQRFHKHKLYFCVFLETVQLATSLSTVTKFRKRRCPDKTTLGVVL